MGQVQEVAAADVEAALEVAAEAAAQADVRIADVHDLASFTTISELFDEIWGRDPSIGSAMAVEVLVAMSHAGNQVTLATRDGEAVGATAALLGRDDDRDGLRFLHSHITGVTHPDAGVGWALKQHQRAWALQRGIAQVRWTFDPLVRRNAVFNLVKLGARITAFHTELYGTMLDERNRGLPTHRVTATWNLLEHRAVAAAAGRTHEPDVDALRRAGAGTILDVAGDDSPRTRDTDADRLLARVPADIETLRDEDPDLGRAWAAAAADTLGAAIDAGCRVAGLTRDGWYVLTRSRRVDELAG